MHCNSSLGRSKIRPPFALAAALLVAGCGQSDPTRNGDPAHSATGNLPAPHTERCEIDLQCDDTIADEPKVDCTIAIRVAGAQAHAGRAGVEKRGRSSLNFPKSNYAVELREDDAMTNRPVDLFGFGADEDWILDGSWADRSFLRNTLASDLFQAFSVDWYAPQSAYCTLELNGQAQGLYRLVERIKQGDARVNLNKDSGDGQSFVIRQDEAGTLRLEVGLEGRWDAVYPKEPSPQQRDGMQSWLDDLGQALGRRSDGDDGVYAMLDQRNVVDWVLLQEFAKNIDAYKLSLYLTKDENSLAHLVPWDFDLSFGQPEVTSGSQQLQRADEPSGWIVERTEFLRDLASVPGFGAALSARWAVLRNGPLATPTVQNQLAAYVAVVTPFAEANFDRWPLDEVRFEQIYGPYHLYEVDSYADEVDHVRSWVDARLEWMDAHIDEYTADL